MQRWLRIPGQLWGQLASEEFTCTVDDLIRRHGAVKGLVRRMEHLGFGSMAHSWLSEEARQPIFSEQLHALFGTGALRAAAAKLDLQPRDFVRQLSEALPRAMQRLAFSDGTSVPSHRWTSAAR
jgi:uncharacterized protein YidB (DUF937 family)